MSDDGFAYAFVGLMCGIMIMGIVAANVSISANPGEYDLHGKRYRVTLIAVEKMVPVEAR